jgi:transcriptional regulator GlxA family with amidase domain
MRTRSRNVAVLLFEEVELLDFAGAVQALSVAGRHYNFRPFKIMTVAGAAGPVRTRNQCSVVADYAFEQCPSADLVLVPGGYGARRALSDAQLLAWLSQTAASAELILGISHGCLLLAKAGLCRGQELAVPSSILELYRELEPEASASSRELASSGKLITTAASALSLEVGVCAVRQLLGPKFAAQVASALGANFQVIPSSPDPVRIVEPDD